MMDIDIDLGYLIMSEENTPNNNGRVDIEMADSNISYPELHQRNTSPVDNELVYPVYKVPNAAELAVLETEKAAADKKRRETNRYIIVGVILGTVLMIIMLVSMSPSRGTAVDGLRGRGSLVDIGKSKHQIIKDCNVKFDDVQGCDDVKDQVEKIVRFLKDPSDFERFGANMPHGYLFAGPPGVGKTMLAKAVAGESGVAFLSISGAEFDEMLVGVGASRVRDLFSTARSFGKAVIFIDEIDAIASKRSSSSLSDSACRQTINQLLVEMDGFNPSEGIVVLAATNTPDVLDPAILRPGRFDKTFFLNKPDINGRSKLLKKLIGSIPVEKREDGDMKDLEMMWLAKITVEYTGADLTNLINHAKMIASLDKTTKVITKKHLMEAKEFVDLGPIRNLEMSNEEKAMTAYHEAGHAIVSLCNEGVYSVQYATIIPRGEALGLIYSIPEEDMYSISFQTMKDRIDTAFGGFVGEKTYNRNDLNKVTGRASSDFRMANYYARMAVMSGFGKRSGFLIQPDEQTKLSEKAMNDIEEDIKDILEESRNRVEALIKEEWAAWEALAKALLQKSSLNRSEIIDIFNKNATDKHKRKAK